MEQIDTLINARWVIPVEPARTVLDHHSVAIRDGRIVAVLPTDEAHRTYQADHVRELDSHAVIPGLINAHTHAAMNLMRGIADDLPLMTWLQEHIFPAEQAHVSPEFCQDGVEAAVAEMLAGGVTCFNDMYFFPEVTARVTTQAGMRLSAGMILIDFPTAYADKPEEYIEKGLALHDAWRGDPLVTTAFAPHAPYTVGEERLTHVATLAAELDCPVHIHVHETADEVNQSIATTGERPLARLEACGLLSPGFIAAHMTQVTETEIERLAATGSHILHCPEANMKLASGFCPVQQLLDAGVNVALGTDGVASNNDLDMFGEMRSAALIGKAVAGDAAAVDADTALAMATINGARALGIDGHTGSLTAGKAADITAVDLGALECQPVYNPVSQLVYSAGRHHVSDVWVAGRQLVHHGDLLTLDRDRILNRLHAWRDKLLPNA
ncbi:TRZ/ATZ family hydrolase [Aquisalimonas asiatica]|uniref:5-methylthioadenosine/S-adenosylhomocysteine deaminase n=1 Tax=Aquisalimonas asiatica TaxID=406100 RepID=A0A1H8RUI3_9GAMM|nr:TRZ/ATZ family hydrolase [Aquisalimonas asiatica]SEO69957.1 Cytosine/adenosine deaminase [Aquisalimonas asiatica]